MNNILCSIIIPYYNVPSELVNRCLNSILNQDWGNYGYEVIFVNDGSPLPLDETTKNIFKQFPLFTLIEQENQGLSAARNAGIKITNGNYIFFVDPDDYWFNNKIGKLLPHLLNNDYDIIKFQSVHIFDGKDIKVPKHHPSKTEESLGCEYMSKQNIIKGACTYCYRNEFIKSNNILMPEGIIHEDEWFLTLAFFKAQKCIFTQIPLYAYIRRDGSIMSISTEQQWNRSFNDILHVIKLTLSLIEDNNLSKLQIEAINNRISYLLYAFIYNLTSCCLNNTQKQHYLNLLQNINLYPLPKIGNSRMYKILRMCSKNKITLKMFVKAVQAINSKRVKGKIY